MIWGETDILDFALVKPEPRDPFREARKLRDKYVVFNICTKRLQADFLCREGQRGDRNAGAGGIGNRKAFDRRAFLAQMVPKVEPFEKAQGTFEKRDCPSIGRTIERPDADDRKAGLRQSDGSGEPRRSSTSYTNIDGGRSFSHGSLCQEIFSHSFT
jgi:hypothetical protein